METGFNPSLALAVLPIYVVVSVGWLARKLGWLAPESDKSLMRLAIDISLPCFIFYNMIGNEKLASVSYAACTISLGVFGICACLAVAWIAAKIMGLKTGEGARTFTVTTGVHNDGFFIIALVAIIYPDDKDFMGLVLTHNVGCDLVFWSLGLAMLSSAKKFGLSIFLKGPVLSVFVALFFIWTGIADKIPEFALSSLKLIGGASIPINLLMFGTLIYDLYSRETFDAKTVGIAVFLRMGVMPCIFIGAAATLPVDASLKKLLVFQALSPCGITAAVLAKHFGGRPPMAVPITPSALLPAPPAVPFSMWAGMSLIGA